MKQVFAAAFAGLLLAGTATQATADVSVVASIKPIHSLVASVMEGIGAPSLIVKGGASPHTYSLAPSDAETLQNAQVIFWVGHEMEAFLEKPLEALPSGATVVSLMENKKLELLPVREGNGFDPHEHEGEEEHEHEEGEMDPHVWLDPHNAVVMVDEIAAVLAKADPANAQRFIENAARKKQQLATLESDIAQEVAPLKNKHFITFHDAFQYFEKRFAVPSSGAISIHPENPPGAKGIREMRDRLQSAHVTCVFSEPQFDPKLVNVIIEGTDVKTGVLDAEAGTLDPGPALYGQLLRSIAASLHDCLG
jgi:zinc transport system substrate-binding protein